MAMWNIDPDLILVSKLGSLNHHETPASVWQEWKQQRAVAAFPVGRHNSILVESIDVNSEPTAWVQISAPPLCVECDLRLHPF